MAEIPTVGDAMDDVRLMPVLVVTESALSMGLPAFGVIELEVLAVPPVTTICAGTATGSVAISLLRTPHLKQSVAATFRSISRRLAS